MMRKKVSSDMMRTIGLIGGLSWESSLEYYVIPCIKEMW
jgi:hypothetical protein